MRFSRRQFFAALPACAAFAQIKPLKIAAVEILEVRGHRDAVRGIDQQYQANPLHIYDELRPAPYRDSAAPAKANVTASAIYLRIRTDNGEGFYGPIDKEVAIVVDEQLGHSCWARTLSRRRSCGTSCTGQTGTRGAAIS